jgi:uncharacterized protein
MREAEYEEILRRNGCDRGVIAHCRVVREIASEYAGRSGVADTRLVEAGAMLHDIGRGITHSIRHAQAGADFLRKEGFPEQLALVVERHTGAGLTADECSLLNLLPRDCVPASYEERCVANADNLAAGITRVTIWDTLSGIPHLPRRVRRRIFRLWLEMEQF